jgi:hypothetical protein
MDNSKEIFDHYFDTGKLLKITLKNESVLEGLLVGFYHGADENDPYIIKWRFIDKDKVDEYKKSKAANDVEDGTILIEHGDIVNVEFM